MYADLPQNLSANVADLSTVRDQVPSGMSLFYKLRKTTLNSCGKNNIVSSAINKYGPLQCFRCY